MAARAKLTRMREAVRTWGCEAARRRVERDAAEARRGLETLLALREAERLAAEKLLEAQSQVEEARRAAEAQAETDGQPVTEATQTGSWDAEGLDKDRELLEVTSVIASARSVPRPSSNIFYLNSI